MRTPTSVAVLLACIATACSGGRSGGESGGETGAAPGAESEGQASVPPLRVLRDVPIITGSNEVERSGTPEALQLVFLVPLDRDSVASVYRRVLPQRGWRIAGDVESGGVVQLYAERNGPPLWIRIQSAGPGAAQYTLIGAQAQGQPEGRPR